MRRGQPRVWLPSFLYRGGVGCFRGRLAEFFVVGGMFCVRLAGMTYLCQVAACHNVSFVLWCCILFVNLKLYKYIFTVFV